jgi:NAD(P)-dependent dehydrogenase (short-subunit alcohol dehydrogenase family)
MPLSPKLQLSGQVALVTGAGRGLGRAIAIALAEAGADIALGVRDPAGAGPLISQIEAMGRRCVPLEMDVLDLGQCYAAIAEAISRLGVIDILINNVGGGIEGPLAEASEEDFDRQLNLNVKSSFFIAQRTARHMMGRRLGGCIVNMASQAGLVALPNEGVYCLAKAAVIHMTKCMAVEWGAANIRVNAVAPTFIETDGTADALARPGFRDDVIERIAALHRIGRPEEVSGAVAFLASPMASMITGHTLVIDGGWTIR